MRYQPRHAQARPSLPRRALRYVIAEKPRPRAADWRSPESFYPTLPS
jgi:hypothetical protein